MRLLLINLLLLIILFVFSPTNVLAQDAGDSKQKPTENTPATGTATSQSAQPAGQLTSPPELTAFIEAEYPATALAQGVEGEVTLLITVDETGLVTDVKTEKQAGYGFDKAAEEAAWQFRFKPAMAGETPVAVLITYTYKFILSIEQKEKIAQSDKAEKEKISDTVSELEEPATATRKDMPVNLTGKTLERGTRKPLAEVEIIIDENEEYYTLSQEDGSFSFKGIPVGKHTAKFVFFGYEVSETSFEIFEDERVDLAVYIEKQDYDPYSVTVRGKKLTRVVTRHILSQQEIKTIPGSQGDVIKVVEVLPGVSRTPGGLGGLLIFRGADDQSSRVYLDSGAIPAVFHFGGIRSVINSDLVESIEFYPGNFGVYYSDSIGGIIDIKTRKAKGDRWQGKLELNIYEGGVLVEGPLTDGLAFAGAFHRNWHDVVLNAVWPEENTASWTAAPKYYDYQFKLDWQINPAHDIEFFWFGFQDEWSLIVGGQEDENSALDFGGLTRFHKLNVIHNWKINDKLSNSLSPGFAYYKDSINFFTQVFIESTIFKGNIRDDLIYELHPDYQLDFGVNGRFEYVDSNLNAPQFGRSGEVSSGPYSELRRLDAAFNLFILGAYTELIAQPVKKLKIIPGVRADYYDYISDFSVDGRATIRYTPFEWTTFKSGFGTYSREPDEPYIAEGYGNPNLNHEWSIQYSLGFEQNFTDLILIDITGFYVDMRDLAVSNPELSLDPAAVPFTNEGKGKSYGFEFILKHEPGTFFSGWISYTLSRSERKFPDADWALFAFDQTHNLAAIGRFKLPANWQIGFRFRLVSGNPTRIYTEKGGVNTDIDFYLPVEETAEATRLPLVHSLDIRVDKMFVFDKFIWTLYLDVQNVYNNRPKEALTYSFDYSEYDYAMGLPIIPAIGTEFKF